MRGFLNVLASGARSLSFSPTMEMPKFRHEDYELRFKIEKPRKPRTPAEIMKAAWDNVGLHMRNAMGEIEKEYGEQLAK